MNKKVQEYKDEIDRLIPVEEPIQETTEDQAPVEDVMVEPAASATKEIEVKINNIEVYSQPSRNARVIARLALGTPLQAAGDPIVIGATEWQPVVFYVPAKKNGLQQVS